MRLVIQSEFARMCNVDANSIVQAANRGTLNVVRDGARAYLDINDPINRTYLTEHQNRKKVNGNSLQHNGDGGPELSEASAKLVQSLTRSLGVDANLEDFNGLPESFTNKLKTLEQIQSLKQKREQARGKLVDRDIVKKMFGKIYTIDVNEFRMLGMNLAPEIAGLAGVDDSAIVLKISERIDAEVYEVLEHVRSMLNDFLLEMRVKELIGNGSDKK